MGHLQTVEADFRKLLAQGEEEALVRFVKEQVLASYHNGQAASGKPKTKDAPPATPRQASKQRSA